MIVGIAHAVDFSWLVLRPHNTEPFQSEASNPIPRATTPKHVLDGGGTDWLLRIFRYVQRAEAVELYFHNLTLRSTL